MTRRSDLSPRGRVFEAVLVVMIVVLCVVNFVRIDSVSNSASDTLINWVPQTAILAVVGVALMRAVRGGGKGLRFS
ncbi:MAG: hypothetical protein ACXWH0_09475 [Acidimicrobiia bacterium]